MLRRIGLKQSEIEVRGEEYVCNKIMVEVNRTTYLPYLFSVMLWIRADLCSVIQHLPDFPNESRRREFNNLFCCSEYVLSPILTVASVSNTGETGDMYCQHIHLLSRLGNINKNMISKVICKSYKFMNEM